MSPGTKAEGHFFHHFESFFLQIDTALLLCSLFEYGTYCLLRFLTEWEEKCLTVKWYCLHVSGQACGKTER